MTIYTEWLIKQGLCSYDFTQAKSVFKHFRAGFTYYWVAERDIGTEGLSDQVWCLLNAWVATYMQLRNELH